jgi:DNA integrity scanning protein DisA with diadenylate cyclase activity
MLSRQGDILVFNDGSLRFTYRYGRWQYWNHAHLIHLLRDLARTQGVGETIRGKVVGAIYRAALDVSFRRSGGLFVVLRNRRNLSKVMGLTDSIGNPNCGQQDKDFDVVVGGHPIQTMARAVAAELAALDGALVFDNAGKLLAYGAVLRPRKAGKLRGTEGSRTKAAIGASNYGLAIKVSSDGDITVYHSGREFLRM